MALIANPAGAPTRLKVTCACGTAPPLKVSLVSTLGVTPPVPAGIATPKVSSAATSALALTTIAALAVAQTVALGAGRQAWYWNEVGTTMPPAGA
ncbi:MAG: hypothetical protein ACN6RD_04455 [Stenotrophomonas maltophilia]